MSEININNAVVNTKNCQYRIEGTGEIYSAEYIKQALEEKAEREKGCDLCNSGEINNWLILGRKYKCCPECGKEL